jgi:hypothetical protein
VLDSDGWYTKLEPSDAPPFDAQLEFQGESNILDFAAHN